MNGMTLSEVCARQDRLVDLRASRFAPDRKAATRALVRAYLEGARMAPPLRDLAIKLSVWGGWG
jgi:hypothetical protein